LDMLRTRASRREDPLDVHVPDPIIARAISHGDEGPEATAVLADSVGLALLVVLEKLEPAERLAFVLHDVFAMTFEEVAAILDRRGAASRERARGARRQVQGQAQTSDAALRRQRKVVDAFLAAVQDGDFEALVAVLDPAIVLRADGGAVKGMSRLVRGAQAVVAQAATFSKLGLSNPVVLVHGNVSVAPAPPDGRRFPVCGITMC